MHRSPFDLRCACAPGNAQAWRRPSRSAKACHRLTAPHSRHSTAGALGAAPASRLHPEECCNAGCAVCACCADTARNLLQRHIHGQSHGCPAERRLGVLVPTCGSLRRPQVGTSSPIMWMPITRLGTIQHSCKLWQWLPRKLSLMPCPLPTVRQNTSNHALKQAHNVQTCAMACTAASSTPHRQPQRRIMFLGTPPTKKHRSADLVLPISSSSWRQRSPAMCVNMSNTVAGSGV